MTDRTQRAQDTLRESGLGVAVLVDPTNMAHLFGFRPNPHERMIAVIVRADGPIRIVVPALEGEAARAHAPEGAEILTWRDEDGPAAAVERALADVRGTIGIEKEALSVAHYELLQSAASGATFTGCDHVLADLRLRKDEDELALLGRAAGVIDRVVARLEPELQPGRTEAELAAVVETLTREEGGDGGSFAPIILTGPKSALPHGEPDGTQLQAGDLVIVDIGATVGGYCSDITRTFVCGRQPDERQRQIYGVVQEAQAAAVAAAVVGATGADVDRAARSVITAAGYGETFVHRTGHGLGLEVHEPPFLHAANREPLPDGAVVTVEPGIYLTGYGGVRIEDDIVVRPGAPEVLTRFPIGLP